MNRYTYQEAKRLIHALCDREGKNVYDTREKFAAMLERHPAAAALGYNPFGKIFFWNDAAARLFGYSARAAFNQDLFELLHPPGLREFGRAMVAAARTSGKLPEPRACDLLRRDGDPVTVFCGHLMFQWDDGSSPEFYCIALDIQHGRS